MRVKHLNWIFYCFSLFKWFVLFHMLKSACRDPSDPPTPKTKRNCVPDECFDRCRLNPEGIEARRAIFASKFPVSEYMDNVSRIGHVIMNTNFHCHQKCRRRACEHPFVVDLNKDIFRKRKCEYINTPCGGFRSKFKPKPGYYYKEC